MAPTVAWTQGGDRQVTGESSGPRVATVIDRLGGDSDGRMAQNWQVLYRSWLGPGVPLCGVTP